jgi:hypothetical protein
MTMGVEFHAGFKDWRHIATDNDYSLPLLADYIN